MYATPINLPRPRHWKVGEMTAGPLADQESNRTVGTVLNSLTTRQGALAPFTKALTP